MAGLFLRLPDYLIYYKISSLLSPVQRAKSKSEYAELSVSYQKTKANQSQSFCLAHRAWMTSIYLKPTKPVSKGLENASSKVGQERKIYKLVIAKSCRKQNC